METVNLTTHRYLLETTLVIGGGDVKQTIDEMLLDPDKDIEVPDLAEFFHRVTISDLDLPVLQTQEGVASVGATFLRLQPLFAELLAAEVSQFARRRLRGQNWAVQWASVEPGSLTLTVVVTAVGAGIMNYKKLREGIVQIHRDIVDHAIPFAKKVIKIYSYHEMFPREAAMDDAEVAPEVPAGTTGAMSPEVTVLLRQILAELRELRSASRPVPT